jgi:hypothetical protein
VAEGLLKRLAGSLAGGGWGAIKYTKTAFYTTVTDAAETASQENKDSTRLLNAGAARCIHVQSPPHELSDALSMAMEHMGDLTGVIVEGNAPLDCLAFDAVIFVFGPDAARFKDSAQKVLEKADIVVFAGARDVPETATERGRLIVGKIGREIRGGIFFAPSLYNSGCGDCGQSGGAELDAIYRALAGILGLEGGG